MAALVVLVACGKGSSSSEGDALVPPGEELGEEFVVPEGTSLVGSRFPDRQEGSWRALLLIEDDPFVVLADLARQAETLGLAAGSQGAGCKAHKQTVLECGLHAVGGDPLRDYSFQLRWGNDEGAAYQHVLVSQRLSTGTPQTDDVGEETDPIQISEIDLPPSPPDLDSWQAPDVGEPVADPPSWSPETVVERETGSSVIAPSGPARCITGGYTTVLTLDDDPDIDETVKRYAEQFEELRFQGETTTGTFEGKPFIAARHEIAGGGSLDAVALDVPGEDPQLLVARCND